jgi:hypothetical protein
MIQQTAQVSNKSKQPIQYVYESKTNRYHKYDCESNANRYHNAMPLVVCKIL